MARHFAPRTLPYPKYTTEPVKECFPHPESLTVANGLNVSRFFVMAGLVPAIHVFLVQTAPRRGCPAQGRA